MLIAIEGVDLTGKSTLAAELEDAWGALVYHAGPPTGGSLVAYEDPIAWYDPLGTEHVILDRWHVGEYVWPAIFRRPTDMVDPAVRRHVEMFMCSRGCTVVYATRDYVSLHEALGDSDEPLRPASLAYALELFDEALNVGHNRGFVFDHDHQLRHLLPMDLEFVAGQAFDDVAPMHGCTKEWIGHPNPRHVVVLSGHSDWGVPGRLGDGLDPTVAHLLRELPERAWRGVAMVESDGLSDEGLRALSLTADPRGWITVGRDAHERVHDMLQGESRRFPVNYGTLGDLNAGLKEWIKGDVDWS
jgi:hypothetical protein